MSGDMTEIRERLARIEEREKQRDLRERELLAKVNEMHEVMTQARGAKWAMVILLPALGSIAGFLGAKFGIPLK